MDHVRPVALFVPALNAGGAQKVVVNLANALVDLLPGPVHVVLASREGPFLEELRPEVVVIDLKTHRVSRSIWALAQYMRKQRPRVLVSGMNYANIACVLAWELAGRPCRLAVREANILRAPTGKLRVRLRTMAQILLMRTLYPRSSIVIANSEDTLESMRKLGINVDARAVVIGNPITVAVGEATGQFAMNWLPQPVPRYICAVGRLAEQKGFDVLLKSFAALADKQLHLVILGEGSLRGALSRQAEALGIGARVHMPGFVPQPAAVMSRAELFVLSSRWEGFGNVLVEALASGVPIVSTDCAGGPRTILVGGTHGVLVPVDDPDALTKGIAASLAAPVGTREGRQARAADFSARNIAQKYVEIVI